MGCAGSTPRHPTVKSEVMLRAFNEQVDLTLKQNAVDMRALTLLIWRSRSSHELSNLVVDLLELNLDERNTFNGIEFYLPMLAHLLVHLEVDWPVGVLEQFTLLVAQQSIHLALQLSWMLTGWLEDYQMELEDGKRNPNGDPRLFNRCATLLEKLELAVVYGTPFCGPAEKLYQEGKISRDELHEVESAHRKYQAFVIANGLPASGNFGHEGVLEYKRWKPRGGLHQQKWIARHFVIAHRVLYCLRKSDYVVKRSIPLHSCTVEVPETNRDAKTWYFELVEAERERKYLLSASSAEERDRWVAALRHAIHAPPGEALEGAPTVDVKSLSSAQLARFGFYRSERAFMRALTDICEELRFVDRGERKEQLRAKLAEFKMPGCVYLPLCSSQDEWKRVVSVIPEKSSAFSTRERCPCLMTFESVAEGTHGAHQSDVASYLYQTLSLEAELEFASDDEELTRQDSSSSRRTLERNEFVRSARGSVTSLDLDGVQLEEAKPRASTVDSHQLQEQSVWSNDGTVADEKRKLLRAVALKSKAVQVICNGRPEALEHKVGVEEVGKAAPAAAQDTRKYLPALGRYMNSEGAEALSDGTPEVPTPEAASDEKQTEEEEGSEDEVEHRHTQRIIAKSNDDLRQEVFTMQMIQFLQDIWADKGIPLILNPYRILSVSQTCGVLHFLHGTTSFDGLKKDNNDIRIGDYFRREFKDPDQLRVVQLNFTRSMAAYSLVCYILGIKDRHNGNIMLDVKTGQVTHIDFGFVLGMAPGKDKVPHIDASLERAAFKMMPELVDAMGGFKSDNWKHFNDLLVQGLLEARKHVETLVALVEIMGFRSKLPCFNQPGGGVARVVRELRGRLMVNKSDASAERSMRRLSAKAARSKLSKLYERFQRLQNGLSPCLD